MTSTVELYDKAIISCQPNFDERKTRSEFRKVIPNLKTVVVHCFDPRVTGGIPPAVAKALPGQVYGWVLKWQQKKFLDPLPEVQKPHFSAFIGPLISDNFIVQPGVGPAFVQLAAEFFDEHTRNAQHLTALKTLDIPVKLIWGEYDPYITVAVAERRRSQLKNASLTIPAGHWLQADEPAQVAKAMLS